MDLKLIQKAEQQMMQDGKSASEIDSMKSAYRKQVFNPDGYSQTAGLGSFASGGEAYGPPPVRGPAPQGIASFENGGEAAEEVYDAGGRFQFDQDIKEPASVRFLKAMFNRDTYDTSLEKARKIKAGEMPVGYEPPGVRLSRELMGMTPLGTVEAGGDMYDEYNKEDPNYLKLGIMGAAEIAGYIPLAGPPIKKMIRGGRGNVPKPLLNAENVEYVSTDFIRSRIPLGNQQRYDVGRIDSAENYRPDEYQYEDFASSEKPSLKESIYNDGIIEPIEIFVHKDGSVALGEGHHRLQAATELGFENVPVVVKVGKPSPTIGTYDSPEPFSKINTSGLKTSGEMRFSDVDFDGRGLPVVKTEGTETHKFLQFDDQGIYTGELGPAKSPSKYTPMREKFINKNVFDDSEEIIEVYHATPNAPFEKLDANTSDLNKDGAFGPGDYYSLDSKYPSQFVGGRGSLLSAKVDVSRMLDARLGGKPFTLDQTEGLIEALSRRTDFDGKNLTVLNKDGVLSVSYVRRPLYSGEPLADRSVIQNIPLNNPQDAFKKIKEITNNIKNPLQKDADGYFLVRNSPTNTEDLADVLSDSGFTGVVGVQEASSGGKSNLVVFDNSVYKDGGRLKTVIDQNVIPEDIGFSASRFADDYVTTNNKKIVEDYRSRLKRENVSPPGSPDFMTPEDIERIVNNFAKKYAYGGEVMDGIGSLNETARNMSRGPRGIAGYQQFAVGAEGVRPQSRPPQIEEMPQLRPQSRPPEIEEMAQIRSYLDNLPEVEPEKFFEINSYDRGEGYEQNAIDFKDGMRMFMPDVERMIENSGMASEPTIGSHTAEEVLKFLQENNPTSEEFIKHFTSARLAEGGQVTAPMMTDIRGEAHRLAYINPSEQEMLYAMGGTGEPGPGGIPAFRGRGAADPRNFGDTSRDRAIARSQGFVNRGPIDDGNSSGTGYTKTRDQASSVPAQAAPPPESNPFLDGAKNVLRGIFSLNSFNNPAGIASLSRPSPAGYSDANQKFANSMRGVGNLSGSRFSPATYTDTAGQDLTTGPKNTRLMNVPSFMGMGIRGLARIGGIKKTDPVVNTVGGERVYKMDGGDHYIMNKTTGLPYMVEGPNDLTFSSKAQEKMDTMMDSMMESADGPNESGPNSCGPGYIWNGTMCVPATGTMGSPEESGIKYASDFLPQTQLFADGGQVEGYSKISMDTRPYPFVDIYQGPPRGPYDSGFSSENIGRPHMQKPYPGYAGPGALEMSPYQMESGGANMGQPLQQYGQYLEQQYGKPDFPQKRDQFLQEVSQKEQQTFQNDGIAPSISVYQGPYDTLPMNNASRIPEFAGTSIEKDYQKYPSMSRPMANFGGNPFDLSHMMSGNMMLANMMGGNNPLPDMGPSGAVLRGDHDTSSLLQAEFDPRSFSLTQMGPNTGGITQLFADGGPVNMENGGVLSSIRPQARTFDGNNERNEARANLMETIYDLESNTDYNKWNLRARNTPDIPLSSMTVKEIMNFQKDDDGPAAGAGQIKYDTFTYLLKNGVISANDVFSSDVQDKAVNRLIDRRGFVSWFEGNTSTEEFGSDMAKEFASLPLLEARVVKGEERQRGQSRYANNEALMGADDWQNVLNSSINMPQTMLAEADVKMPQTMFAEADVNMSQTMPPETFAGQPPVSAVPSGIGSFESSLVPPAEVYAMRGPLQKGPPVAEEEVKEYESLYEKYAPQAFQDALQGIGYYNSPMGPSGSSSDTILASR